jgi:hypothetical protein
VIYDSIDRHLATAGSIDRAAVPLGMYLAWCAGMKLLSPAFEAAHEDLLLRLRYREVTGSVLLTAGCGGVLSADVLNAEGRDFTERHLDGFFDDLRASFGPDIYGMEDSWQQYDRVVPLLMQRLMGKRNGSGRNDGERRWWQIWR